MEPQRRSITRQYLVPGYGSCLQHGWVLSRFEILTVAEQVRGQPCFNRAAWLLCLQHRRGALPLLQSQNLELILQMEKLRQREAWIAWATQEICGRARNRTQTCFWRGNVAWWLERWPRCWDPRAQPPALPQISHVTLVKSLNHYVPQTLTFCLMLYPSTVLFI